MNYGELKASLRTKGPQHLYLLAGEEGYYIDKAEKDILQKLFPEGYTRDDIQVLDESATVTSLVASAEAMPFFTDKNVILVRWNKLFKAAKAEASASKGDKSEEALLKLLADIPEFTYIIFTYYGKADKRKKIYKAISSYGCILESELLRANNIDGFVQSKLQELNKQMDREAYEYFIAAISSMQTVSLSYIEQELDKLALFLGKASNKICKDDVVKVLADVPEISGFAMINAIAEHKVARALQLYRKQQESGVYFTLTVGLLARQVKLWWLAKSLGSKGLRGKALASTLGQPPFLAEKLAREARGFTENNLKQSLLALSDTDYLLKTGAGDIMELEAVIIQLCCNNN